MSEINSSLDLWAIATDPVYIGTGGYTIGRVDNTIVRDPITKIPKIPGTSLAGTWRYYMVLYLHSLLKEDYKIKRNERSAKEIKDLFKSEAPDWVYFEGNRYTAIKCAGQDVAPVSEYIDSQDYYKDGHCGSCIVCKAFGYSKQKSSWQGMLFFSDLNILFFPVYTRLGVKWITSFRILQEAGLLSEEPNEETLPENMAICQEQRNEQTTGWINLGWLNLPYIIKKNTNKSINLSFIKSFNIQAKDIYMVPDSLISQIINSNLEVRTSVSINPLTGAAKDSALFTSEAIPRATVFYGKIRIVDKNVFSNKQFPSTDEITSALEDSKHFYETMGIGGMTTRGFGRLKIEI
jgi:CRISPR-associated protein Cmr4